MLQEELQEEKSVRVKCFIDCMYTYFRTAEYDDEMFEIKPSTSYSMRKETPDNISDTSIDNAENNYSDWRRETPLEELGTTATAIGNEE